MKKLLCILLFLFVLACSIATAGEARVKADPQPGSSQRAQAERGPSAIHRASVARKLVALTFDDGPDPVYTPQVLDFLADHRIHATFFVVGEQVQEYPEIVKREVKEGHSIGNHTYSHRLLTELSASEVGEEIEKGQKAIEAAVGIRPRLFRSPYGRLNRMVLDSTRESGCSMILWSACIEHRLLKTPQEMADRVLNMTAPGAIILVHDGRTRFATDRSSSVAALKILVEELKKQGYQFVTVPELMRESAEQAAKLSPQGAIKPRTRARPHAQEDAHTAI